MEADRRQVHSGALKDKEMIVNVQVMQEKWAGTCGIVNMMVVVMVVVMVTVVVLVLVMMAVVGVVVKVVVVVVLVMVVMVVCRISWMRHNIIKKHPAALQSGIQALRSHTPEPWQDRAGCAAARARS